MDRAIDAFLADVRGILVEAGASEQGIERLVERMQALVHDGAFWRPMRPSRRRLPREKQRRRPVR